MHPTGTAVAQTSFEFMVYMAVAILAMAAVLPLASHAYAGTRAAYGSMRYGELAGEINYNMQFDGGRFEAYVPKGVCLPGQGWYAVNSLGGYALGSIVEVNGSVCKAAGAMENLSLTYSYNGAYELGLAEGIQ